VHDDAEVSTDASRPAADVDQVSAAREWLRRHGVDPADLAETSREVGPQAAGAAPEAGYERSRRSPSGPTGTSLSGRRARRRRPGADDDDSASDAPPAPAEPDADPEQVARDIVLRKLAVQARTRVELERALQGRDVPEDAAGTVLDRMTEVGLVDDVTFAHDWVASRQQRRHLSRTALRRELQTKGVERDVIDEALAGVENADEHAAALDLAQRRARTMGGLAREVAYRRLGGVLARRGFSASTTAQVLSEVLGSSTSDD
jgi:regulatory protein